MTVYLGGFENQNISDEFNVSNEVKDKIKNLDIIVAVYNIEGYEGDAFVLFKKNNKLYEVNDSHCSCHGLENWEPEETTKESLLKRLGDECNYGLWKAYKKELLEVINNL